MITYNNEFRVIDTPEKAYVLGFIYSDGCIGNYNHSYTTEIVQHINEEYLVDKIQSLFPFFRKSNHTNKGRAFELINNQKALYDDLTNLGLYQAKSNENRNKLRFPNIPKELQSHFIRGYFDGDGSVYRQKIGNTKLEIGGTCYYMITDIIKILYDNGITVNLRCKYAGEGLRTLDFYILYTSSDKISKQFAEFIYKDCGDLYMKRKYDKLFYIPEYHKMERLICPMCNNSNTVRLGPRRTLSGLKLRGMCKDCNKRFSITAPVNSNINSGEDELLED